jgi:hypothetical protein
MELPDDALLCSKELAERWGVSPSVVHTRMKDVPADEEGGSITNYGVNPVGRRIWHGPRKRMKNTHRRYWRYDTIKRLEHAQTWRVVAPYIG